MFSPQQYCPRCQGAIPREHYVQALPDDFGYFESRLYCEFCGLGLETLWQLRDGEPYEEFSLTVFGDSEPVNFGKFLQRLEDTRAA